MPFEDWESEGRAKFHRELTDKSVGIISSAIRRDMYSVLAQKTSGEAKLTSKNSDSDGIYGYIKLVRWYTETSGQGKAAVTYIAGRDN